VLDTGHPSAKFPHRLKPLVTPLLGMHIFRSFTDVQAGSVPWVLLVGKNCYCKMLMKA